jgi:hypothetical protein
MSNETVHVMEMDSTALQLLIKYMKTQPYMIFRGMPEKIQKFVDLQGQYCDRLMTKDKVLITSVLWMWSMMDIDKFKRCLHNTLENLMEDTTMDEGMKIRGADQYKKMYESFILLHNLLERGKVYDIEFEDTVNFLVYIHVEK